MAYKIISVSYGHGTPNGNGGYSASGKLYDYGTDKNYRAGDVVVVPVTHPKSGKMYNTLAVVQMTHKLDSPAGQRLADHLTDPKNGYKAKDVRQRLQVAQQNDPSITDDRAVNITTLPGYKTRGTDEKWSAPKPASGGGSSRLISRGE